MNWSLDPSRNDDDDDDDDHHHHHHHNNDYNSVCLKFKADNALVNVRHSPLTLGTSLKPRFTLLSIIQGPVNRASWCFGNRMLEKKSGNRGNTEETRETGILKVDSKWCQIMGNPTLMRLIWEWKLVAGNSWESRLGLEYDSLDQPCHVKRSFVVDQIFHKICTRLWGKKLDDGTLVFGDKNPNHKSWRTSFLHDVFFFLLRLAGSPD